MRAFITGSSGFVGSNLVLRLLETGHDITTYDAKAPRYAVPGRVQQFRGDLLDRAALTEAYEAAAPDVVFHLGARTDLHGRTAADYAANTDGTTGLIEVMRTVGGSPYTVYASSRLVFSIDHRPKDLFDYKPSTVYGRSKIEMERIVLDRASSVGAWTIVRPTSLWGPYFEVPYRDFFDTVRSGRFVDVGGRNPRKSFGYVGNAVHELIALAEAPEAEKDGKVLWLSDYVPLDVRGWAGMIAREFGVRQPRTVPYPVLKAAALAGDAARRLGRPNPPITSFRLNNLLTEMVYDTSETEAVVGPLPYSLQDGVRRTVEWMRASGT